MCVRNYYLLCLCLLSTLSFAQINSDPTVVFNWTDTSLTPSFFYNNTYNEVWGFVQNGEEYAVIGTTAGTHIFRIVNEQLIYEVAFVAGADQGGQIVHRDYHDYNGYLYAVADEGASTLQIIDLSGLPYGVEVVYDSNDLLVRSHNIFIDTLHAKLYAGANTHINGTYHGMEVFSLEDPLNPQLIHEVGLLAHDMYVIDNLCYLNGGDEGLFIYDFNGATPTIIGALTEYSSFGQGYNHSGWTTKDGNYYAFADENHGLAVKIAAVSDPSDITIVATLSSEVDPSSMAHNLIIRDDYLYISYYHDGLQIFDISDPVNPVKVSSYKTYQPSDHISYRGAWGVYPYLPSGLILVSDMQYGLFVLDVGLDTGVGETTLTPSAYSVAVYPRIVQEHVSVEVCIEQAQLVDYNIYNIEGKLLHTQKHTVSPEQGVQQLYLPTHLPSGMLILQVKPALQAAKSFKITKQ